MSDFTNYNSDELITSRCSGLHNILCSIFSRSPQKDQLFDTKLDPINQFMDWDRLNFAGKLPIFSVSTFALLSQPLIIYVIAIYNDVVMATKLSLDKVSLEHPLHAA